MSTTTETSTLPEILPDIISEIVPETMPDISVPIDNPFIKDVVIVGAGLVGSLLAILLAKRGYHVNVLERRPDMRKAEISAGRSINLALSERGWKGLEAAGIAEDIQKVAIPMRGRTIHTADGTLAFQPYGKEDQAIYSVSRGGLNMALMDLAEQQPNVTISFLKRCSTINLESRTVTFEPDNTGESLTLSAAYIIGADGAFSAVRTRLQQTDRFDYSQEYLEYGYKELSIPPAEDGSWRMEKHSLHIWPRGNFMLIALPNLDGSFTCTLFFPFEGTPSFEMLKTEGDVLSFFQETFTDAAEMMPTLVEDFFINPTSSLVTVKCYPWVRENVMLIGDAAHAIVPFFGQGMNAGFEDCRIFNECLNDHEDHWDAAMQEYQQKRKINTDAIAGLAVQNFIEMRDLVGDPMFLLRKKIEKKLNMMYPDRFIPLYSMVSFSNVPYAEALSEGKKQDILLQQIMSILDIMEKWDSPEVEEKMREWMEQY